MKYCDPQNEAYQFKFYVGEEESKIVTATDTTLTIVVPEEVSSGLTYLVMDNQAFYGPLFSVLGNVSVDTSWGLYAKGANDIVYGCLERYTTVPNYFVVWRFTTIGDVTLTGIGYVDYQGTVASP